MNDFFKTLANCNSRNFKIEFLTMHKDNELLKEVIRLALDPFTQFYIRKIPDYEQTYKITFGIEFAIDELKQLSSRKLTGNAAIEHLRYILSSLKPSDAKVIEKIIQKDLKCGVSIATANAVWSGLIQEYPCMLCSAFDEKLVNKIQYPAYVQTKMDGMRFNAIVKNGTVEYRSRNGKEIQLLGNLDEEFLDLAGNNEVVFDGELLVVDSDGNLLDRQTGNGILNKANKGTIKPEEAKMVVATLWDMIPYDHFIIGKSDLPYSFRFGMLEDIITSLCGKIRLVQSWTVDSYEESQEIFKTMLLAGQEGIILKDMDSIWEDKRSKSQIKFKAVLDADLKCVDVQMGTGKYEGMIGSLICESSDGIVKVSVGSGLTDEDRKNPAEYYIEKIIAITYNGKITNKQGEQSLFLPIYIETRSDKDEANSSMEL